MLETLYKVTMELKFVERTGLVKIPVKVRAKNEFEAAEKASYALTEAYEDLILDGEVDDIEIVLE